MSKEVMAQTLFDNGDVNQVDPNTFVCHGSNGNQYEITKVNDPQYNYKFYCKCPAWKFDESRRCKHVIAVELFEKNSLVSGSGINKRLNRPTKKVKKDLKKKYTVKKDGNKNTMDWTEPDGSKTKFQFDENGTLIGKVSK